MFAAAAFASAATEAAGSCGGRVPAAVPAFWSGVAAGVAAVGADAVVSGCCTVGDSGTALPATGVARSVVLARIDQNEAPAVDACFGIGFAVAEVVACMATRTTVFVHVARQDWHGAPAWLPCGCD
jgi:hypothetical protein